MAGPHIRQILEGEEENALAPYAIRSSECGGREHKDTKQNFRTEFQRDRDRVLYSTAFRRLEYKTQVFPNHEGDHYRTRMTHTIEVANLSRTLARALRLNQDFSECLALVHDIGHPPYGHCGEEVLSALMADHGGFEHNHQSYRIVTLLENSYTEFPGLNLTREIRDAILQHTKFYQRNNPTGKTALLETLLVSIADEMVYDAHDIEDGLSSGILTYDQLAEVEMWQKTNSKMKFTKEHSEEIRRRTTVRAIFNGLVLDFITHSRKQLEAKGVSDSDQGRVFGPEVLGFSKKMQKQKDELEAFLHENMYQHPKVLKMMNKSKYFLERLFVHFKEFPQELPRRFQKAQEEWGLERTIADYVSGMTDRFLQEEYVKIFMPFQKML